MTDPQASIYEAFALIQKARRVILAHPDVVDRVQAAIDALPFEYAPGLLEVRASQFLPPGQVVVLNPNAFSLGVAGGVA